MQIQELSKLFAEHLVNDEKFQEVLPIVKANTIGKIWLVGSAVYRPLTHKLYGGTSHIKDYDFLVEQIKTPLSLPGEWKLQHNRYGNPKLTKNDLVIDIVPVISLTSTKRRSLPPSIEHYLTGTPFTIQSILYDPEKELLVGEIGIKSILTKTVTINCREEYEDARLRYGETYSAKKYIDGLGFREV